LKKGTGKVYRKKKEKRNDGVLRPEGETRDPEQIIIVIMLTNGTKAI